MTTTENQIEQDLIAKLGDLKYTYRPDIRDRAALEANFRAKFEALNRVRLTDSEFHRLLDDIITPDVYNAAQRLRNINSFERDDGTPLNYTLVNIRDWCKNDFEVVNQLRMNTDNSHHRYDVMLLINGLPVVQIELKTLAVSPRRAMQQIVDYKTDPGNGYSKTLLCFLQLFIVSNRTDTWYFANNNARHFSFNADERFLPVYQFASEDNKKITLLDSFAEKFLAKCTLGQMISRYMVLVASEQKLLMMRPYQIYAVQNIVECIDKNLGNGYIWHTTGSGKTLTSFKAAQLARGLPEIDKVWFVVDRKDLDYQTMREYERFEKGAANSNTSTAVLQKQLEDPNARIIITTIQKLSRFVAGNKKHPVYDAHVVVIFDECHRSQFGDMHAEITRVFKRYHLFGFTGTPIFAENAGSSRSSGQGRGGNPLRRTTAQAFGDKLHTYTIVDAINDKNVLPFRIDYINTIKKSDHIKDKQVSAIDTERALLAPERSRQIVSYIREHFDQKTKRAASYQMHGKRLAGFNALFATASIDAAKRYYAEFVTQQKDLPEAQRLKVGLIYSFAANEEDPDGLLGEEEFETAGLDQSSRDFLEAAIRDYNALFETSFDTSADKFQNYYKDLSERLKTRQLDLVIVVNMFLTGFDATTLNTLWVDKNLKAHGLIQAYSRTNRILNSVKTYGNIVSFRNLEDATNDALALFGNKEAKGIVLLKPYADYYSEYQGKIAELQALFPLGTAITGEAAQKAFIKLFGAILRLKNILTAFDDFAGNEILSQRDFQDYQSLYLNLYAEFRAASQAEKESINDDVVFEIELIKQVEINVDYILMLVEQYLKKKGTGEDKEIRANIERAVNASPSLRNKKDLIEQFVDAVSTKGKVDAQWQAFVVAKKAEELERIIAEENLNAEATRTFIDNAFRDGAIPTAGTAITKVLPPVSRFSKDNGHGRKKQTVLDKLAAFFERYFGLVG